MPRSLTDQEKKIQRNLLLKHGKDLITRYGLSRVSVDDIVKDAGVAKGSFYNYFSSKDDFIYSLIFQLHEEGFAQIKDVLKKIAHLPSSEKRQQIKVFFLKLLKNPQQRFFIEEHNEVQQFLLRYSKADLAALEKLEQENYQQIFDSLNLQGKQIEILQNAIHILFFGVSHEEILIDGYIDSTVEILLDGLLSYLEV
ncbi:TetR/AcrR family transcriptional regulator [Enterococcus sp. LJL90]